MAQSAIEPGAAWSRFVDEDEGCGLRSELAGELVDVGLACAHGPEGDDLGAVLLSARGDRDGCLVDSPSHVKPAKLAMADLRGVKLRVRPEAALASSMLTRGVHRRSAYPSEVMMSRPITTLIGPQVSCFESLLAVCLPVHSEVILMVQLPEISPVTDLRQDAAAVLKRVQTSQQPLVITQRGRAAAIMLSVAMYERGERERELLRLLVRGEQEIAAGVGHDLDEVLAEADALLTDESA